MPLRVEVRQGSAFDVLLQAAAVADPTWRETFDAGVASHARILAAAGPDFVARVSAFGRFGWLNLVGLPDFEALPDPWSFDLLLAAVESADPERLHLVALGGDRRQLVSAIGAPTLHALVRGEPAARAALDRALAGDDLVVEITQWLRETTSVVVHAELVDLLRIWRRDVLSPSAESTLAGSLAAAAETALGRLRRSTGRAFLDLIVPGLRYATMTGERVLAVPTGQVSPVVVVVDGLRETMVLHPPLRDAATPASEPDRLLELARAVGDRTRIRLLTLLQPGQQSAVDLARAMRAPRTTLLHHLAILRAAGLIETTVRPGGATWYRLNESGFAELSRVAGSFVPTR